MKNRGLYFHSECCKDPETVFVFVLARMVHEFYSFEIYKKSQVKIKKIAAFLKN